MKLTAVAIGGILLTAGHAAAKNHDCQSFKLPIVASALHDRAPGPSLRDAN
ncbi:MAG: hypothetical protein ACRYGP_20740 [Janthinobacterium lividum]